MVKEQIPLDLNLSDECICQRKTFLCDACKANLLTDEIGRVNNEIIERETGWSE